MKPRILMILPRIPVPARDGAEVVILETLRAFRRSDIEVDVFALNPSRQHRDPSELEQFCSACATADISTDVGIRQLISSLVSNPSVTIGEERVPLSYWISRFIDQHALTALEQFVQRQGPYDIIHCETLFTVFYGLALPPDGARAVVYRSHNVEWRIQERLADERSTPLLQRVIRRVLAKQTRAFEIWISRHVHAIATISATDAAWYSLNTAGALVRELHPGLSIEQLSVKTVCGNTIGFLGSLDWEPNRTGIVWFMERVLPLIVELLPDVRFSIAGRGSKDFCDSITLPPCAVCVGEVESVSQFYATQAIAVAPVLSGSGIRIKLLEAFALSTPIVTTTQGAEGLDVHHGDECMIVDDPELFAQACVELLCDSVQRDNCSRAARTFVEQRYSHQAAVAAHLNLYQQCLERF